MASRKVPHDHTRVGRLRVAVGWRVLAPEKAVMTAVYTSPIRCPKCKRAAVQVLQPLRKIATGGGGLCGCKRCGRRWWVRLAQGEGIVLQWIEMGAPVDLSAAPPAKPQPVETAPGWREFYQEGNGQPDGVSWAA